VRFVGVGYRGLRVVRFARIVWKGPYDNGCRNP